MSIDPRGNVIRYWWSKAEESVKSAKRECEAGFLSFAINRLYYAAFYGVSAALLDRKISFKKHSGVRAAFHQQFIKPCLLDIKWGRFYDQLFEDRQEGDYVALVVFEREYVETQIVLCFQFMENLRVFISVL